MANELLTYHRPNPEVFDELLAPGGEWRDTWSSLPVALRNFDVSVLLDRQRTAGRMLEAEGAGYQVREASAGSASTPWLLDPIPYLLSAAEFDGLSGDVVRHLEAVDALLADCYTDRRAVEAGIVSAADLYSLRSFRPLGEVGAHAVPHLTVAAVDVVRAADGSWCIVGVEADAPVGLGYSILNRMVMSRVLPDLIRAGAVAPVSGQADVLRRALLAAAPGGVQSPRAVVLSPGPDDTSYVEHSYLASRLGLHLVESGDVVMRDGGLWLRVLDGVEHIDVVYRRVPDDQLDPLEPGHVGGGNGVPGLVWGARRGGVSVVNPFGAALVESAQFGAWARAAAPLFGVQPSGVALWHEQAGVGTAPVLVGHPAPTLVASPVVVRLQVARTEQGFQVMPGGSARVLAPGDHPSHPTALRVKDVWVVGGAAVRAPRVVVAPQVDFGGSVPTRVADAMFQLGRAAERAEVLGRTVRVLELRLDQDPGLVSVGDGTWAQGAAALSRAARSAPHRPQEALAPVDLMASELEAAVAATASQVALVLGEAASVREYLSGATGLVLGRLAETHRTLVSGRSIDIQTFDAMLLELAALSGLALESTVRGPSWRFLDIGRRVERALWVLGSVESVLGLVVHDQAVQPLTEALLQTNESLTAYRRRYRSEVELGAVLDLLVHDDHNPRSLSFQLDRLREHVASLEWSEGLDIVDRAGLALLSAVNDQRVNGRHVAVDGLVLAVRAEVLTFISRLLDRWFSAPVRPSLVRGR